MVAVQSGTTSPDTQFESVRQQYPALAKAHQVARSSRSPQYFQMSNQLFERWVKPLGVDWIPETIILNNLMVSIDKLFEAYQASRELQIIADELSSITRLNTAMLYLLTLPENNEMTLEESVKTHLAFITAAGHKRLQLFFGDETADSWLEVWQHLVSSHNNQQRDFSIETLQPDTYKPGLSDDLNGIVQTYLSRYEKTGGLSMAIIGSSPFSRFASPDLFSALAELKHELEPFFRLVQDICLDTSEVLNLGIFVVAIEKNMTIAEARRYLQGDKVAIAEVEARLRVEEQHYLTSARNATSKILERYPDPIINRILTEISQVLMGIAKKLSDDCKSFREIEP